MIEKRDDLWWPASDMHGHMAYKEEISHVQIMANYCKNKRLAVQAGGNTGAFAIEFSRLFGEVYTFEPDETNYECLFRNTCEIPNIQSFRMGLGDKHKTSGMKRLSENCGAHYMEGKGDIVIVPLDDFDLEDCDLLQLDVEGYEYFALQGATETIKRCKPVIICEEKGLGRFHGIESDSISCFLLGMGYKIDDKLGNDVIYTSKES